MDVGKHEVSSEGLTRKTSETNPVPSPFESSNDATNSVSADNGKKVIITPVAVAAFQLELGTTIEMG